MLLLTLGCVCAQNRAMEGHYEDIVAVDSAYDDILAMSATLHDPAVSQLLVPVGSNTEGYEVMHSAPLSLTVRDEVRLHVLNAQHSHMQSSSARQDICGRKAAKLLHNSASIYIPN